MRGLDESESLEVVEIRANLAYHVAGALSRLGLIEELVNAH
jgi:hypothetical protein